MLLKILLIGAVIFAVYFIFFKKKPLTTPQGKDTNLKSNDMVECASCQTYVEVNEALLSSGKYFCSNECLEKR